MIRVLLADDQQLIREALAALLGLEVDLQIVGQVGSGDEVLGAVALLKPDVVLLDVQMPGYFCWLMVLRRLRRCVMRVR